MTALISDLLDYSRIGSGLPEMIDCNEVIRQVLKDLKPTIDATHAAISVAPLPVLRANNLELRLLFQNLLSNALKFRKKDVRPLIKITMQNEPKFFHFMISDNGIGIDEKHRDNIFIIFQRLYGRKDYEGTGIGLAHCRKIVEMHGGAIWVESVPGEGSTFHFTFPKTDMHYEKTELHPAG
jgi:light-regulated signal transduction histidine kinase (bacteriophytochrome)